MDANHFLLRPHRFASPASSASSYFASFASFVLLRDTCIGDVFDIKVIINNINVLK